MKSESTPEHPAALNRAAPNGNGQLQAVLDTAVDGIVVIDERGIVQTFNRAAAEMFGYPAEDVLGRNVSLLMPPPYNIDHDNYLSRYLQTGDAKIIGIGREALGVRKNGQIFPIELAVSQVVSHGRRSFTGIIRDISERKRMEKALLEVSEREQRKFASDLHDGICQELAGIAMLAKTVCHKLSSGDHAIHHDAARITDLIQNALKHARGLAWELQPVDPLPEGLTAALRRLAAETADRHGVRCEFHCPVSVELPDPMAATHLYRIVQECVSDAVQLHKARNLVITLIRRSGDYELSVRDDGTRRNGHIFAGHMVRELIERRARVVGAHILCEKRRGNGAQITCRFSIPPSGGVSSD